MNNIYSRIIRMCNDDDNYFEPDPMDYRWCKKKGRFCSKYEYGISCKDCNWR